MEGMETIIYNVEGMSCNHCITSIEGALNRLEGVCHSKVILKDNTVEVMYEPSKINADQLKEVITDTGYEVVA